MRWPGKGYKASASRSLNLLCNDEVLLKKAVRFAVKKMEKIDS